MTTSSSTDLGRAPRAGTSPVPEALAPAPWARVAQIQLIRREVREYLSVPGLVRLFASAERVVEGGRDADGRAYTTVMLTVDLDALAPLVRETPDAATAARVAELLEGHPWLARHLRDLARASLQAHAPNPPRGGRVEVEFQVRCDGQRLLVDCDAMLSTVGAGRSPR